MDTNVYLGTEATLDHDVLLGYGLALNLPLDDKVRERRNFREPTRPTVAAWSLFQSLVEQHGISEALRIYSAMEAERKGPFQPGAKYDPDKDQRPFVAPVVARMERGGSLMPMVVPRRRKAGLRMILPPRGD